MPSNTHFFENVSLSDNSIMANCAFMESPSNHLYPNFVQSPSQEEFLLWDYDTVNPCQHSTTHKYFKDQKGSLESNDLLDQPQMPPSVLENHKKANGRKKNVKSKATIRRRWSKCEDRLLTQLVEQYGDASWARIAKKLPLRIGKQCRERWQNCLRPNIKKVEWSEEDDKLLIALHQQFGNKWADIARYMPGRSENSIKNHWNATIRKKFKFSFKGHEKIKHHSYLLKDYITSISSSSSAYIQESLGLDPQNHETMTSLNARSSSFPGSALGCKSDELVVSETDFGFDFDFDFYEVSSHFADQLQFDPPIDTDFIGSISGFSLG